jgi:hypothetical protein
LLAEVAHAAWCAAPLEMNEGTPLGSEYNKPSAVVLKGPTAELYRYPILKYPQPVFLPHVRDNFHTLTKEQAKLCEQDKISVSCCDIGRVEMWLVCIRTFITLVLPALLSHCLYAA